MNGNGKKDKKNYVHCTNSQEHHDQYIKKTEKIGWSTDRLFFAPDRNEF